MSPTISTKKTKQPKRVLKSRRALERENLILLIVGIACAVTVVVHLIIQVSMAVKAGGERARELQAIKSQRALELMEDEERFASELEIAKRARGENIAEKRRAEEFERRFAFAPEFAESGHEKAMLEMREVGADEDISSVDALKKIARLASPARSGVGVFKRKRGYKVEVAFSYQEVIKSHPEVSNYLPGIYREVRRTAAGIIRDVFAFGDNHGVSQVVVSCQNVVSIKTRGERKKELRDLFVVSTYGGRRDWSRTSRAEAEDAWKTKKDLFPSMLKRLSR